MAKRVCIHRVYKQADPKSPVYYVWRCSGAVPGCTFSLHPKQEYHLLNRDVICWDCGELCKADEAAVNEARETRDGTGVIRCMSCRLGYGKTNKDETTEAIAKYLAESKEKKRLEALEKLRAHTQANTSTEEIKTEVEEDKPESEYIPPKYDVDS